MGYHSPQGARDRVAPRLFPHAHIEQWRKSYTGQFIQHVTNEEGPYFAVMLRTVLNLQKCLPPQWTTPQMLLPLCNPLPCESELSLGNQWNTAKGTQYDFRSWVTRNSLACLVLLESLLWEEVRCHVRSLNTLDLRAVEKLHKQRDAQPSLAVPSIQSEVPDGEWRSHLGHPTFMWLQPSEHTAWEPLARNHPDEFKQLNYKIINCFHKPLNLGVVCYSKVDNVIQK